MFPVSSSISICGGGNRDSEVLSLRRGSGALSSAVPTSSPPSSSISNMRSAVEFLARNDGLLDWPVRSRDVLDRGFGTEGDWSKSSKNAALALEPPDDFASRSWSRVCKDTESILVSLLRAINSGSRGYFSIRSSSALPLFAIGRHAS